MKSCECSREYKRMTLGQWKFEEHETLVKLSLYNNGHVLPKFRVTIYASLKFRISIFGWNLIASHPLYTQNEQSVKFLSVRDLLNSLESFTLCCGVPKESCVEKTVEDPTGSHNSGKNIIVRHTIPVYQDAEEDVTDAGIERSPLKNRKNLTKNRLDSSIASNSSMCSSSTNVTANSRLISSFSTNTAWIRHDISVETRASRAGSGSRDALTAPDQHQTGNSIV